MGQENGRETMEKSLRAELVRRERVIKGLTELKNILHLPGLPRRIECYDIPYSGHRYRGLHGGAYGRRSAAQAVPALQDTLRGGQQRFRLHGGGGAQALFPPKTDETGTALMLSDLVVIDGGKGQLSSACGVLDELGLHLDVIGLLQSVWRKYIFPAAPSRWCRYGVACGAAAANRA